MKFVQISTRKVYDFALVNGYRYDFFGAHVTEITLSQLGYVRQVERAKEDVQETSLRFGEEESYLGKFVTTPYEGQKRKKRPAHRPPGTPRTR